MAAEDGAKLITKQIRQERRVLKGATVAS